METGVPQHDPLQNFQNNKHARRQGAFLRLNLKDWSTLALSVMALGISALTAYFSQLQQVENLEGTVIASPTLSIDPEKHLRLTGALEVAFLNNGNKPIAILDGLFLLNQLQDRSDEEQCFGGDEIATVGLKGESFVIEPSKIVIKKFDPNQMRRGPALLKANIEVQRLNIAACLQLRIVTSRGGEIATDSFGVWLVKNRNDRYPLFRPAIDNSPGKRVPMIFVNRSKLRFIND